MVVRMCNDDIIIIIVRERSFPPPPLLPGRAIVRPDTVYSFNPAEPSGDEGGGDNRGARGRRLIRQCSITGARDTRV